ncbi:hypothetical protein HD554DRAFT_2170811 [Boletus coccyginus]|nr:hypothetical protein HD554DRAFT_2170811 [Boletus coccyginus]
MSEIKSDDLLESARRLLAKRAASSALLTRARSNRLINNVKESLSKLDPPSGRPLQIACADPVQRRLAGRTKRYLVGIFTVLWTLFSFAMLQVYWMDPLLQRY